MNNKDFISAQLKLVAEKIDERAKSVMGIENKFRQQPSKERRLEGNRQCKELLELEEQARHILDLLRKELNED